MPGFRSITIEPRLVRALKKGDRDAAGKTYGILAGAVHGLASRILNDANLAAEVTQDTFVDVIERASTVTDDSAFVGWVRSIAVNHCLMRLRSPWYQRRHHGEIREQLDPADGEARLSGLADAERALELLPPEARFVVWMHEVEGYTHTEIGRLAGKSASYSKSQLARAYARLAAWTEDSTDDDGRTKTKVIACVP